MKPRNSFPMPDRQTGATLAISLVLLTIATLVGIVAMQGTTLQEKMAGNLRDSNLAFQAAESALAAGETAMREFYNNWRGEFNQDRNNDGIVDIAEAIQRVKCPPLPPHYYGGPANPCNVATYPLPANPPGGTYVFPLNVQNPMTVNNQAGAWVLDEDAPGFPLGTRLDPDPDNATPWWYERNRDWWLGLPTSQGRQFPDNLSLVNAQPRYLIEYLAYPANDPFQRGTDKTDGLDRQKAIDNLVVYGNLHREKHFFRITAWGQGGSDQAVVISQSIFSGIYYLPNQ